MQRKRSKVYLLVWVFRKFLTFVIFTHNSLQSLYAKNTEYTMVSWMEMPDKKGQRKMARFVQAARSSTVTQMSTLYNCGGQKKHLRMLSTAGDHIGFHSC